MRRMISICSQRAHCISGLTMIEKVLSTRQARFLLKEC
jgi:hypothetical protein